MTASLWRWRLVPLIGALLLAGVASVAYAMGVATTNAPAAQAAQPTTIPGHPELGPGWTAPGNLRGAAGGVAITITNIQGSKLSLQTTDGWTRTIDTTGATVTKGGQTIAASDLKVGDQINFRESRQSDGTYKVTTIAVLLPTASGTVKAVGSGSVTITQFDGSSKTLTLTASTTYSEAGATVSGSALVVGVRISAQGTVDSGGNFTATAITIAPSSVQGTVASKTATAMVITTAAGKTVTVDVSSATKYSVRGISAATLANVAVGDRIAASGTLNADGSLNATAVQAVPNDQPGFGGFGPGGGRGNGFGPGGFGPGRGFGVPHGSATPTPSAAGSGSTT
ncbi:MAG TPA: DUF5666 domain-containing protein [Candidatus Limnocylindrales bacterium]|jgi:hypothetical protein